MLRKTRDIASVLECGCNIDRNISFLNEVAPRAQISIVEISKPAFDLVSRRYDLVESFNGSILESRLTPSSFDLVFTMGVLIHINPDQLLPTMAKIFEYSSRYVLIGEYLNRTPTMIEYRGEQNRLFKRDFGKLFIENFAVSLVDYGFPWGHVYDAAGFDDITW